MFVNSAAMWSVLRHIFATNVAWTLFAERREWKEVLLKNTTSRKIITGDQPVIKTYGTGKRAGEAVHDLEFFYPVSPALALLITRTDRYPASGVAYPTTEEVQDFNRQIARQANGQLYAETRDDLVEWLAR